MPNGEVWPDWESLSLGELHAYRKLLDERTISSTKVQAAKTGAMIVAEGVLQASRTGRRIAAMAALPRLRLYLVKLGPFYPWAVELLVKLPVYESRVTLAGNFQQPLLEIVDLLKRNVDAINLANEEAQRQADIIDGEIGFRTRGLMRRLERGPREPAPGVGEAERRRKLAEEMVRKYRRR